MHALSLSIFRISCVLVTYTRYLNWRYLEGVGTYHSHLWNVCVNTHVLTYKPRATVYQSQNTWWTAYHDSERHDCAHPVFVFIPSTEYKRRKIYSFVVRSSKFLKGRDRNARKRKAVIRIIDLSWEPSSNLCPFNGNVTTDLKKSFLA